MARTSTRTAIKRGPKLESKVSGQSTDRKSITEPPEERPNISTLPKQDEADEAGDGAEEEQPFQSHADTEGGGGGRDMRHRAETMHHHSGAAPAEHNAQPYLMLAAMAVLSFIAMYILMYAMVDRGDNVFNSINQVYMAGLMAAPMVVIELLLMGRMYPSRSTNMAIGIVSLLAMAFFWFAIRSQLGVGDAQFLRSMIPHHAGAVLMCNEAPVSDPRIVNLCQDIIAGQEKEIAEMKTLLAGSPPQ